MVIDTMVVVSAVIGSRTGPSSAVLDAVATGEVRAAISDAQLSEMVNMLGYGDVERLIAAPVRAFEVALSLGTMGFMHRPRKLDWPSLTDQKDYWIFDLAHASNADYIVTYDGAVRDTADALGFEAVLPEKLLEILRGQPEA